jgi:glyceraldehyde-3-phosphate dehydrogenase/erythrose-4-phosphate dehydrogenase
MNTNVKSIHGCIAFFCVLQVEKKTFAEEVNNAFKEAANGPMKGVLAVSEEPLVSVDFRCTDVSSTIDSSLTMVMGDDMVKVVAWYDNGESTHSQRYPYMCGIRQCDRSELQSDDGPGGQEQHSEPQEV